MSSATTNEAISRSASRLRWAVFVAIGLIVLLYGAARFGVQVGRAHVEYRVHGPDLASTRLIGDISVVLLVAALYQLARMLGRIASGELFTAGVIGSFRAFALWLLVMALFGLFAPALVHLLFPPTAGHHQVRLALDFRDVLTVGVTLSLFLVARLLERARRLDEEVREFV